MESPFKTKTAQPKFTDDKENLVASNEVAVPIKGIPMVADTKETAEAAKDEESEDILKENPHRFVLFPIKYHEVCCISRPCPRIY